MRSFSCRNRVSACRVTSSVVVAGTDTVSTVVPSCSLPSSGITTVGAGAAAPTHHHQRRHCIATPSLDSEDLEDAEQWSDFGFSSAGSPEAEIGDGVVHAVDHLLDDFVACRGDILRQFAKTKGAKSSSKAGMISDLINIAYDEASEGGDNMKATRRLLGDDAVDVVGPSSGLRSSWTNQSLETTQLESACQRILKGQGSQSRADAVRQTSSGMGWIVVRLIRAYQDDYENVATAAVGGVHRAFHDEAQQLFHRRTSPNEVIAAFASYLATTVKKTFVPSMVSQVSAADTLTGFEVVTPAIGGGDVETLERLMGMLEHLTEDMEARENIFKERSARYWGVDSHLTIIDGLTRFLTRHRDWELQNVPQWVTVMATQFSSWELLVRNDVPALKNAPKLLFDVILLNVVAVKLLKDLYGHHAQPRTEIPPAYRRTPRYVLEDWLGDSAADEIIMKLHQYVQVVGMETKTSFTADLAEAILSQMQALLPDSDSQPSNESIALILREVASTSSRAEGTCSTYELVLRQAEDMRFHLRFAEVYKRLSARDKKSVRTNGKVNMIRTLEYFEEEFKLPKIDYKSVAFMCIVLHYLSCRGVGQMSPVLYTYNSCTQVEELSIVKLGDKGSKKTASDVKVALPPQLSHESWLEGDKAEKGVYNLVASDAVKGATNNIMLLSQAPMLKALDAISKVPWRINKYMLFVQESMVQEGYAFGKINASFYPLNYCRLKTGEIKTSIEDKGVLYNEPLSKKYASQKDKDWKELTELRSSRVHYLQALRQARALMNHEQIFFPNSMDFRGRMYPLPGRLNHTGSDPFRALLENAVPKELGKTGLYWLKVHLANKMGQTKVSFDERAAYVDEHITDVVQSAEAPQSGDRWWQEGAEPLQALMACKELADALKYSQGAEKFPSRIAVAVDGSYNGLQHYSAIGRDEFGAKLVNLVPSDRPADAYTGILKEMLKSIQLDAENDNQIAMRCLGSGKGMDKNHLKRKTIKQPIMTQVYGVTGYGMSEQVLRQLEAQNKTHGLWTATDMKEMAAYIRDKVLESLGVTFKETQLCRQWLGQVARIIWECQPPDLRNAFSWTTPLGLIVRQPYLASKQAHLFTAQGYTKIAESSLQPAGAKQMSALAPNLIHSLDATHLAMTAFEMSREEKTMMAVHDSYWTHACDLPDLARILRTQFVHLYDGYDPLWEIKEQWEELFFFDLRRHGAKLPDPPPRGNLDLKEVLNSPYFFS